MDPPSRREGVRGWAIKHLRSTTAPRAAGAAVPGCAKGKSKKGKGLQVVGETEPKVSFRVPGPSLLRNDARKVHGIVDPGTAAHHPPASRLGPATQSEIEKAIAD
jgi:hypothetical protein